MRRVPNINGEINNTKSFEYDFIKILIMGIGSLEMEDDAELDEESAKTATNFILYVAFVILVPILMINILIGISIDELQKMINDSKYENMLTIIDYMINLRKNKFYKILYMMVKKFIAFQNLKSFSNSVTEWIGSLNRIEVVRKNWLNYKHRIIKIECVQTVNEDEMKFESLIENDAQFSGKLIKDIQMSDIVLKNMTHTIHIE
ncbi:hypothetical protein BpHYR1_035659 [Brachionus plicatilis]|uniref:Transient receptor potential cation channel subfamily A member 1 n=1 Tax=Brachionus plicatilis TaxID=10195 RepID=A0A3M7Q324_BRAPC|nr:hypothetical protein BpHYR1_035659 [Brachionus plicatilis]